MKYGWLSSRNRKRHQRAMNALMRELNENIQKDNLWRGRFEVRQTAAQWYPYPDGSGADLYVVLTLLDKQTNKTQLIGGTVNHWRYSIGWDLWLAMNNFIIENTK